MCDGDSVCDLLAELEKQEAQAIKDADDRDGDEGWLTEYIDSYPEAAFLKLS
ncbi:MAG: hypothetical protein R3B52_02800 [Candidatus Paceibacterota bacterium]